MPKLADADIDLIHALWLDATKEGGVEDLHHREIVTVALARLAEELKGPDVRDARTLRRVLASDVRALRLRCRT